MKEVTWMDRGIDEKLFINNVEIGTIDHLSAESLLHLLHSHGVLKLKRIDFDEYLKSYKAK